jgi:endonuclease-3
MKVATTDQQAGVTATRRLARILTALRATSPAMNVELDHRTPWELLVATILSAQCTDQRVNQVTPNLFRRYQHPHEYASADPAELEALIRPTGFFKTKARNLIRCAKTVAEQFHGEVPDTMEALTTLPGSRAKDGECPSWQRIREAGHRGRHTCETSGRAARLDPPYGSRKD